MHTFNGLVLPTTTVLSALDRNHFSRVSTSNVSAVSGVAKVYDLMYYLKGALAGGICCAVTHGGLTPVDVVKTRLQLDPVKYNKGLIGGFGQVIKEEGMGGLLTGLGPTVVGYFIQGKKKIESDFFAIVFN